MKICFVVNIYPNEVKPSFGIFVQRLAFELKDQGHDVTIIHPLPVTTEPRYCRIPYYQEDTTLGGNKIPVYRPKVLSLGQSHPIFGKSPIKITTDFFEKSAIRVIEKERLNPDCFYGHFLAPSGIAVARIGRKFEKPAFCAFGESHSTIEQFGADDAARELSSLSGAIAVSSFLLQYLTENRVLSADDIEVIPNAFNPLEFGPGDKLAARKKLEMPKDGFIVGFVGWLDERKGSNRLDQAFDDIEDAYFACAGTGPLVPKSDKCLFAHHIDGSDLKTFYNAIDVFALPTLLEGCSNAIVEAIACGLPVISSDLPFNFELLDQSNSILIDPTNVEELRNAIIKLRDNPELRTRLACGSLEKSKEFTLTERATKIVTFIEARCKQYDREKNM